MTSVVAVLVCFGVYFAGYVFYSRYLAQEVFALRADFVTPAHALEDGVDYVPTRPVVLFGHHFASITGLSPMLGPAIAVVWGWLPAMIWVVFGSILVGCVHDFGALVISVRAKGLLSRAIQHELDHLAMARMDRDSYEEMRSSDEGNVVLEEQANDAAIRNIMKLASKVDVEIPAIAELGWFSAKIMELFMDGAVSP